jgi:diacylglycerol kinase (ATP)
MDRTRVIVNPAAGGGAGAGRIAPLRPILEAAWRDIEWCASRSAQHLTDLCADAAQRGYARVVVCGGDGTVHFAARGLAGSATALGIVPIGTGNDFAMAAGIPADALAAARMLTRAAPRAADLGAVGSIPFCCVAGIGMDAVALRRINRSRLRRGPLLYKAIALRTLTSYVATPLSIDAGGERFDDHMVFAAVSNTPSYAGGNRIAPAASIFDGQLDWCTFADRPLLGRLDTFARVQRGRHVDRPGVRCGRAVRIGIGGAPLPLTLDGELTELTTPAEVRLLPGALRLLCRRTA